MDRNLKKNDRLYLIIDFETCTPKGISPVPIEFGYALFDMQEKLVKSDSLLFGLPRGIHLSSFDIYQTGITDNMIEGREVFSKELFMSYVNAILEEKDSYDVFAHNARYEGHILKAYGIKSWKTEIYDTLLIGKHISIPSFDYKLDSLGRYFNISIPEDRHRASADSCLTGKVLFAEKKYALSEGFSWGSILSKSSYAIVDDEQLTLF